MNVLVDTLCCGNRVYGVGRVVLEHLRRLAGPAYPGLRVFVVVSEDNRALFDVPGATQVLFPFRLRLRGLSLPLQLLWERFALPGIVRRLSIDVFLRPNLSLHQPLPCPQAVMIHDLAEFHPEGSLQYSPLRRLYRRAAAAGNARRAERVLTVSRHAAAEISARFPSVRPRLAVVLNGPPEPVPATPEAGAGSHFLVVGKLLRHKNHMTLLRAYVRADRERRLSRPLVIVGGDGNASGELKAYAAREGYADRIRFVGYVGDREMEGWYRDAAALLFPTFYEGFGLPVLEGMARGLPVICSNAACLPEVAGKAALLLDPHREEDWARALADIDAGRVDRAAMAREGLAQVGRFSWDASAAGLAAILESMGKGARARPDRAAAGRPAPMEEKA